MGRAKLFVVSLADELVSFDDHTPDHGVGFDEAFTFLGEFQGFLHPFFVVIGYGHDQNIIPSQGLLSYTTSEELASLVIR